MITGTCTLAAKEWAPRMNRGTDYVAEAGWLEHVVHLYAVSEISYHAEMLASLMSMANPDDFRQAAAESK